MKKKAIRIGVLGMLVFVATAGFAVAVNKQQQQTQTVCNPGDKGVCVTVAEGKACKRISPDYIGDCGSTSEVQPPVE